MNDHSRRVDIDRPFRRLLSTVPEITVFFWIVKVLSTTVGETFADFLSDTLGLGPTLTTVVTSALLAVALTVQFRTHRYVPAVYWLAVVLAGIVGTLLAGNLTDDFGVPLGLTTIVFALALAGTFAAWYATERTLSIHTVDTPRREAFYWLAILFTFALGTAAGDLVAEAFGLGWAAAIVVFAAPIAVVAVARRLGLGAVLAFWPAYVLTRPLGAALGDLLAQPAARGGLGLGAGVTSVIFLIIMVGVVVYLTRSRIDRPALGIATFSRAS